MNAIKLNSGVEIFFNQTTSRKGNPMIEIFSLGRNGQKYNLIQFGTGSNLQTLVELVEQGHIGSMIEILLASGDKTLDAREKATAKVEVAPAPIEAAPAEAKRKPGRPRRVKASEVEAPQAQPAPAPVQGMDPQVKAALEALNAKIAAMAEIMIRKSA